MMALDYLEVGKIVNTHGIKGEVKVIPLTDDPARFQNLKKVYIDKKGTLESVEIEAVKYQKTTVILKLKGINDLTAAET